MADILIMDDGSQWLPATSIEVVRCAHCDNIVDTPEEAAAYPNGDCPECGNPWTEKRSVAISVTVPQALGGEVL